MADERERRVEVQGEDVTVAFTNRGARLVSWRLSAFATPGAGRRRWCQTAPGGPRALDIETGDPDVDERLREALFLPAAETVTIAGAREAELRFR